MKTALAVVKSVLLLPSLLLLGCAQEQPGSDPPPTAVVEPESPPPVATPPVADPAPAEPAEPGVALDERFEGTEKNVRVNMSFDQATATFSGRVENMGRDVLQQATITVQQIDGTELGSASVSNVESGSSQRVEIKAAAADFSRWTVVTAVGGEEAAAEDTSGADEDPNS